MSRVHSCQKFMNISRKSDFNCGPSKMVRIKGDNPDYTKARNLTSWLFLKYDMSYKTYRNKSKKRREELRSEYEMDTGKIAPGRRNDKEEYWDVIKTTQTMKV